MLWFPYVLPQVPRVFERIQQAIMHKMEGESAIRRWLFDRAWKSKKAALEKRVARLTSYFPKIGEQPAPAPAPAPPAAPPSSMWDSLVFDKV